MPRRWNPSPLIRASTLLHAAAAAGVAAQPAAWPWALGLVAANHGVLTAAGLWPRSRLLGPNWTYLPPDAAARREIALTIDDGPHPEVTPRVLDLLDAQRARASFFVIGEHVRRHPSLAREIVARGHAVENHSQHHLHTFSLRGVRWLEREIRTAQDTIFDACGRRPRFFRAPAGLRNPFLEPALARLDLQLTAWTRRGFDTRNNDPRDVARRLLRGLAGGDILLLHDGNAARTVRGEPLIVETLPLLLRAFAAAQLRPVTLCSAIR